MTVQEFIYTAGGIPHEHDTDKVTDIDDECILCGKQITCGIQQKKIIGTNFSQRDELRKGDYICEPCAHVMKGDFAIQLRRASFLVSEGRIFYFKIQQASDVIFHRHETPFVLCITTSYKKHNAFRAILNYSDEEFVIRWEDRIVNFNRKEAAELYKFVVKLYYGGFTKDEIRTGNFPVHRMQKYGVGFVKAYEVIQNYIGSDLLDLLTEIAPSIRRQQYQKIMKKRSKKNGDNNTKRGRTGGQAALFPLEES